MQSNLRQRLLASTLMIGVSGFAAPAWAQPTDEDVQENSVQATIDEDAGEGTEAIVVTGSRIQRRDLTSTSPLAVVQDEEFKLSGAINVEQVINTLPQVVPGASAFDNNPGGGVATLNLRGLGPQRTLVLVNGRRWMFYDENQIVDLNTIPQFLIDSVDVVTGGASAVYGSDALAGVVNFRLRTDLNGFEGGASYSLTEEGDGARFNAYVAAGADFADGRGNVTVFGEYFKRKDVFASDREFSRVAFTEDGENFVPGGSPSTPAGRFFIPGTTAVGGVNLNACTGEEGACLPGQDADFGDPGEQAGTSIGRGAGTPFDASAGDGFGCLMATPGQCTPFRNPEDFYNYAPVNYLMVPQERWLLGGYASYEISDAITAFTEVTFVNNRVANELAATPLSATLEVDIDAIEAGGFLGATELAALREIDARETRINEEIETRRAACSAAATAEARAACEAALGEQFGAAAEEGVVQIQTQKRTLEAGSRNALDERNAFRVLAGVRGPAFGDFTYEAYYSFARTRNSQIQEGNISRSAFEAAVQSGAANIFGPGTLTQAALDSFTLTTQNSDISTLQVASASISGSVGNFGMGADNIGVAVGVEYRKQSARFIPDQALGSGDVIGFNAGAPTAGGYDVREAYAELRVPIIADRPGFHRLEVNGAARYSDYSLAGVGDVWTYAGGVEWAPIRDITLRAQYQRASRAPNVGELFGGQTNGFPPAVDPCGEEGEDQSQAVRTLCEQTGVPAALVFSGGIQPAEQIEALFGGNPNLGEETSDTYTIGAVLRPSFIPRLNIAIDYFNIKVDDYITTVGGGSLNNILSLCYNEVQDINSEFCQIIANGSNGNPGRDPATGVIGDEFLPLVSTANIASLKTSGVDVQVDYTQPLGMGLMGESSKLNFFFLGTWTETNEFTPSVDLPDIKTECAGFFGLNCGQPQPEYKWTSRLSWVDGPLTTSLRWRHIGKVTDDDPDTDYLAETLKAVDYFDLSFSFDVSDEFTMALGVNNLFDEVPQTIGDNQEQSNTYPNVYDVLGRDYFVSASFRF